MKVKRLLKLNKNNKIKRKSAKKGKKISHKPKKLMKKI
jgi:hypothetical protein